MRSGLKIRLVMGFAASLFALVYSASVGASTVALGAGVWLIMYLIIALVWMRKLKKDEAKVQELKEVLEQKKQAAGEGFAMPKLYSDSGEKTSEEERESSRAEAQAEAKTAAQAQLQEKGITSTGFSMPKLYDSEGKKTS